MVLIKWVMYGMDFVNTFPWIIDRSMKSEPTPDHSYQNHPIDALPLFRYTHFF